MNYFSSFSFLFLCETSSVSPPPFLWMGNVSLSDPHVAPPPPIMPGEEGGGEDDIGAIYIIAKRRQ
jgi:hypothetical protein